MTELGIDYVHIDAAMLSTMSGEARRRLTSPSEFRPVFQAPSPQSDLLYAVVPQTRVGPAPAPSSFHAFAQLAAGRRVLISSATHPLKRLPLYYTLRSGDGLYGEWGDPGHFRRDVQIRPPTEEAVDLIVLPNSLYPSPLDPAHRAPVWDGGDVWVYDLTTSVPGPTAAPPIHVDGRSLLDASGIQITSVPGWPDTWTGTDWVLYRETEPSTGIPAILERGERWFPGQLAPQSPGQRIRIRFDASRGQLEHQGADGAWSAVGDAAGALPAGSYVLTLRFSTDGRPMFFVPIAIVALDGERPHDRVFVLGGT